jgi:hypothetical protein
MMIIMVAIMTTTAMMTTTMLMTMRTTMTVAAQSCQTRRADLDVKNDWVGRING